MLLDECRTFWVFDDLALHFEERKIQTDSGTGTANSAWKSESDSAPLVVFALLSFTWFDFERGYFLLGMARLETSKFDVIIYGTGLTESIVAACVCLFGVSRSLVKRF